MQKNADAFRTISEVADDLALPQHVLRFWETRFPQIRPLKRAGGRRYYRPNDILLLRAIRQALYDDGYTIKGVQKLLKEQGAKGLGGGVRSFGSTPESDNNVAFDIGDEGLAAIVDADDESGSAGLTALHQAHRAQLEHALSVIEDCKRILDAVR